MAEATFHSRANAVRAESRMLMQKLRAERLASSRHRTGRLPATEAPSRAPAPVAHSAATSILPSRKVKAAIAPPAAEPPAAPKQKPRKAAVPAPAVVKASDPVEEAAANVPDKKAKATKPKRKPTPARHAEVAADAIADAPAPDEVAEAPPNEREPAQEPADVRPLSALSTLGPGMIWRLNQIGLVTVGDLANADPEQVRESLGGIAKLIRVETLIERARSSR